MLKSYIEYVKYTFTKDSGSDDFDVLIAVIPMGFVIGSSLGLLNIAGVIS